MNLDSALSIAGSGLANVNAQLALVSQNVANASTPSYSAETSSQQDLTASGDGMGVVTGPATITVNAELQAELMNQNATVSGLTTTQTALSAIDAVNGTPGQGSDLGSLLGDLEDQFSTLLNDPDDATQQSQVVASATTLAQGINTLSNTYTAQRQTAENNIVSEVNTINQTLGTIGSMSNEIVAAQAAGQSTADLENQRNAQVSSLSQLISINTLVQSNGNMLITTSSGTELPTNVANPLSTSGANLEPGLYYPGGGVPAITLNGVDVTDQLQGGSLGANITLRDTTLPTYQGELDEFSQNLANQFAAQGLDLFTDASGNVPAAGSGTPVQSGYVGFASEIQVNPAVQSDPSLVTDGTNAIAGSSTGASAFTPNPADGPSGFTTLITRVLDYTFGADVQSGVAQPASNTTGLGPAGNLNAPYQPQATLAETAAALVGAESSDSDTATSQLDTAQTLQSTLQSTLTSDTGVNMDTEMSDMIALQNAYGANAHVMSAVQSMFNTLLSAVSG
jgi:flagellar hook-associated protein 1